jgi:Protein of unknown function (DUF3105)
MASRAEEKRLRREEREAKEAAARAAQKKQRTMMTGGVVLLVIAVAAVAGYLVVTHKSSSSSSANNGGLGSASGPQAPSSPLAQIPAPANKNLVSAAKAAGCVVRTYASEGRTHTDGTVHYKTNPPTSGNHNPTPALDGVYAPNNTPTPEHYVHTLEHGRIELQYAPSQSRKVRLQLQSLLAEAYNGHPGGYKVLLFQNNTGMPYAVAATAWTHLIGCKAVNDKTWDALRDFRNAYVDKAPEGPVQPPNDL